MPVPDSDPIDERPDDENPEWTDEDFARAVPFTALPAELQAILSDPVRKIVPDADGDDSKQPAA